MEWDFRKQTVGAILTQDSRAAAVFDAYAIDYCCQGNERLEDVCRRLSISDEDLAHDLKIFFESQSAAPFDFGFWPLSLLAAYIERKHHRFVKTQVPVIVLLIDKAMSEETSSFSKVKQVFLQVAEDVLAQVEREERILFPYLRKMEINAKGEIPFAASHFDQIRKRLIELFKEQRKEEVCLRDLRSVTKNYSVSTRSSHWERIIYPLLENFDKDMKIHLHLEKNLLFPRAIGEAERVATLF